MMSNEFEKALDAFLEGAEADEAHQALYDITTIYMSHWIQWWNVHPLDTIVALIDFSL